LTVGTPDLLVKLLALVLLYFAFFFLSLGSYAALRQHTRALLAWSKVCVNAFMNAFMNPNSIAPPSVQQYVPPAQFQ
jgi:hypothetical protein